jgi:Ca2+-binding EF-hand superfamily protein
MLSPEELQAQGAAHFTDVDTNGDGGLSAEEMIAAADQRAADRAARMIARFDANGDGILQIEEMPMRGQDRAARMFDRVDADEDGLISEAEFEAVKEHFGGRGGHGQHGRG